MDIHRTWPFRRAMWMRAWGTVVLLSVVLRHVCWPCPWLVASQDAEPLA
jgi:hypothetical protein